MSQKSGLDSLLEALKQSGVDVDSEKLKKGGAGEASEPAAESVAEDDTVTVGGDADDWSDPAEGGRKGRRGGFSAVKGGKSAKRGGNGGGGDDGGDDGVPFSNVSSTLDRLPEMGKKFLIILLILILLVLAGAYWWFHPPINLRSTDTWFFGSIFILLPCWIWFRAKKHAYKKGNSKVDPSPAKEKTFGFLAKIPWAILCVGVLGAILSLSIIPGNAAKYASVLETSTEDFATDIAEVNYKQIPVIDRETAILLGNKEMGSIPEYVSQFEVSDLYSQINYKSSPVRVSPLGYADLFKWLINRKDGIPAYSLVNMTTQDAQIVRMTSLEGDGHGIKYTTSEPLGRNIDRYVQLKYPFYMFDEKSFEVDESGHPYWICPVQTRTIGLFGGTTIKRVVLCDACTGECTDMKVEDVPEWIDRVYPAELLLTQYNWYGKYLNGWWNSFIGQSGVVQTTPGTNGLGGYNYIAKDDDVWVYTGVTSVTSDSSIVGFVLVNQRTQESHFYAVSGATETSAMSSAEGQVQNLRYTATFPILINVGDQPTYFMALKDGEGLVKKFAMVDIQRYQNVAVGDTVAATQKSYLSVLTSTGVDVSSSNGAETNKTKGKISNMAQAVVDGNSHFYVTLEGSSKIYDFPLPDTIGIVGFEIGDTIQFSYYAEGSGLIVSEILGKEIPVEAPNSATDSGSSGVAGTSGAAGAAA